MDHYSIIEIDQEKLLFDLKSKGLEFTFVDKSWSDFIIDEVDGEFLGLRIKHRNGEIHYFIGISYKKYGVRIIGSPFPGWGTAYMGIVGDGVISEALISSLLSYLFKKFPMSYIEIISKLEVSGTSEFKGCEISKVDSLIVDLSKGIDNLYKDLKGDCRTFLRQFETRGGVISEEPPDENFVNLFYIQLSQVFERQGMVPTHSYARIKNMLNHISTGEIDLLCLQAKVNNSKSIASAIFFGLNGTCYYWAGASTTDGQQFRPNESMIWYAIKYFEEKGYKSFNLMGVRDYKLKFSPNETSYSRIVAANPKFLYKLYSLSYSAYLLINRFKGFSFFKKSDNKFSPNLDLLEVLPYEFMHYKSKELNISV